MYPSVVVQQVEQGILDFLRTTFSIATPHFHGIMDHFLSGGGLFSGPYLSLSLPFEPGLSGKDRFSSFTMAFPPYAHQDAAFDNLSGPTPVSTLVATGTGSGKTECFLYPILYHCQEQAHKPGIKAILIYPMNALATDQAGRIARLIHNAPSLNGNVTAGLYVGSREKEPAKKMTDAAIISDKETLRKSPPDILLTNYKMLDYLLTRPQDAHLWADNDADTLKFLVVDELHTFDGAQGTDLACLIRRLKDRLHTPEGGLCCVGTSATLGHKSQGDRLREYAQRIFGEPFGPSSLITEKRKTAGEFLGDAMITSLTMPGPDRETIMDPDQYPTREAYLTAQYPLWFNTAVPENRLMETPWRIMLGDQLKGHLLFQNLVKVLQGGILSYSEIWNRLSGILPAPDTGTIRYPERLLGSFTALISHALSPVKAEEHNIAGSDRDPDSEENTATRALVDVRVQYWLRELGRMVVSVGTDPRLAWSDDLTDAELKRHLPVVHCRECGAMGWLGVKKPPEDRVIPNLRQIYNAFFSKKDKGTVYLFPEDENLNQAGLNGKVVLFCGACLHFHAAKTQRKCPSCGESDLVQVFIPDNSTTTCPYCQAHRSLTLMGSRAASLTSVMISQMFASTYNDDRKLITFSDNVQDAAHRAGFFGARTWGFNLRVALQKVVDILEEEVSLSELPDRFTDYWSGRMTQETYIATFIAPNMEWFADYDHLVTRGVLPTKSNLVRQINNRLKWEIHSEYGFDARIGRTLEKSGVSMVHAQPDTRTSVVNDLLLRLPNEVEACRDITEKQVEQLVCGMVNHLRINGAVYLPYLEGYLKDRGNDYLLSTHRISWMQGIGPTTRAPKFLTSRYDLRNKNGIIRFLGLYHPTRKTWCDTWVHKLILNTQALDDAVSAGEILKIAVRSMVTHGLLTEILVGGYGIWGLVPDRLRVTTRLGQIRCDRCGHLISAPEAEFDIWEGAPCIRKSCFGACRLESTTPDYYGKLFQSGEVARLFTCEHTGLLDRDTRQKIEIAFKAREEDREPWAPNLLSCTPTMEMGIDIGDLSATIQCSVPPAQASYLQRIGRAGRKNGNALNLTVANLNPHDLYFFASPIMMMAGQVNPPGVFLDAAAVLERQFTAFCFDRWVAHGIPDHALPVNLGTVIEQVKKKDESGFPHTLMAFVSSRLTGLLDDFYGLFKDPALSDAAKAHVQSFAGGRDGGDMGYRILNGLTTLVKERDRLQSRARSLYKAIKKKENDLAGGLTITDEIQEMKQEKAGLQQLVKSINRKNTFNFFTDEGFLPNYAFPEQGVTLHSIIFRHRKAVSDGERHYDTFDFQYERGAGSALSELAPHNVFYAGGRRVRVDQIDLQLSPVESWRCCRACSYTELAGTGSPASSCPRCGNTMWSDAGRQFQMIRMRQVFATTPDDRSRISDDRDQRSPEFYVRHLLMDYEPAAAEKAWQLTAEDTLFGYTWLSKAVFREINFGPSMVEGETVVVAGQTFQSSGFTLCRHCGKVPDERGKRTHTWTCPAREKEKEDTFLEFACLYREFSSEAVKILLPMSGIEETDVRLQSFIAAFHLGMKQQFGGDIDHLRGMLHTEPMGDGDLRIQYLVIYDTVPGGTGYLKELIQPGRMVEILKAAQTVMETCVCASDEHRDGCYSCLFAYRNSRSLSAISRRTALAMIQEILAQAHTLEPVTTLSKKPMNSLFDSDLERLFIEAVRRRHRPDIPVGLVKKVVNGSPGFLLTIGDGDYKIRWEVMQQVELGPGQGVSVTSKADFVFYPVRQSPAVKPVVVFTDGYTFHRDRAGKDMAQRMALVKSGGYHIWSLSYKDVKSQLNDLEPGWFTDWFTPRGMVAGSRLTKVWEGFKLSEHSRLMGKSAFDMFFEFLSYPDKQVWQDMALVYGLSLHAGPATEVPASWREDLAVLPPGMDEQLMCHDGQMIVGGPQWDDLPGITCYACSGRTCVMKHYDQMGIVAILEDLAEESALDEDAGFETHWNGFLRAYNLLQFLSHIIFLTRKGLKDHQYDGLVLTRSHVGFTPPAHEDHRQEQGHDSVTAAPPTPDAGAWNEVRELADEALADLILRLENCQAPVPGVGEEVADNGVVLGELELAWQDRQVGVVDKNNAGLLDTLTNKGWQLFSMEQVILNPEDVIRAVTPALET